MDKTKIGIEAGVKTKRGWISPDGVVFAVEFWRHLQDILQFLPSSYDDIRDEASAFEEEVEHAWAEFAETYDGGGAHNVEIWESDVRYSIQDKTYNRMYVDGWVRFSAECRDGTLEAEGRCPGLQSSQSVLKDLADAMFCRYGKEFQTVVKNIDEREAAERIEREARQAERAFRAANRKEEDKLSQHEKEMRRAKRNAERKVRYKASHSERLM